MNDANIKWYLENKMQALSEEIEMKESFIRGAENNIDEWHKEIKNLRVHYTSLLNTAIAYGHEVEEDEQED